MFHELALHSVTSAAQLPSTGWSRASNSGAVVGHPSSGGARSQASWDSYRLRLAAPIGPLEPSHVFLIDAMWKSLKAMIPSLPGPEAAPSEDGRIFGMTWDRGNHHFEIEVLPSGKYEWFYMDFSSAIREGEEDAYVGTYSSQMASRLLQTLQA